jgi:hypothetical protein
MDINQLTAAQDEQRTQRNFIALLGGALGVGSDTSLAGQDGYAVNGTGQYQTMAPYGVGGVGVEGRPISSLQPGYVGGGVVITLPMLLLGAGAAYLLMK